MKYCCECFHAACRRVLPSVGLPNHLPPEALSMISAQRCQFVPSCHPMGWNLATTLKPLDLNEGRHCERECVRWSLDFNICWFGIGASYLEAQNLVWTSFPQQYINFRAVRQPGQEQECIFPSRAGLSVWLQFCKKHPCHGGKIPPNLMKHSRIGSLKSAEPLKRAQISLISNGGSIGTWQGSCRKVFKDMLYN